MAKLKNSIVCIFVFIFSPIILSGCWDYRDINEMTIVLSIGIDIVEGEYEMTGEYAMLEQSQQGGGGENGGGQQSQVALLKATGKDFEEARGQINVQIDNPVFLGATNVIIFGSKYAESGIESYINRIDRLPDYRKTALVVISRETPGDLFELGTDKAKSVGMLIESNLRFLESEKEGMAINVGNVLSNIDMGKVGYLLPYVGIVEGEIQIIGMAVMCDNKLVGSLDLEEAYTANYLEIDRAKMHEVISYNDTLFAYETEVKNKSINFEYKDEQLNINIDLKLEGTLDYQYNKKYLTKEDFDKMEKIINAQIEDKLNKLFDKSQKVYKSDIFKLAKNFRAQEYQLYKVFDWKELYLNANINVTADVSIIDLNLIHTETERIN